MSDEGFLKRWSRRKRADTEPRPADDEAVEKLPSNLAPPTGEGSSVAPPGSAAGKEGAPLQTRGPQDAAGDAAIDPATLPPLESLGPDSDYTVFLRKGVPEALRTAALRKAWMSDPFIRDFRGPAEYAIDYTTSEFNLLPTDDVGKMLDRIFPPKAAEPETAPEPATPTPSEPPNPTAPPAAAALPAGQLSLPLKQADAASAMPGAPAVPQPAPARRKHGGALPDEPIDLG